MATKPNELEPEVAGTQLEILLWGLENATACDDAEQYRTMVTTNFSHLRAYLRSLKRLARAHRAELQDVWFRELTGGIEECERQTKA